MNNKILIIVLILGIILLGVLTLRFLLGGPKDVWLCQNGQWIKYGSPVDPAPTTGCGDNQNQLIVGDKDEHNCLVAAGYSWCEAKNKCLRNFEEFCPDMVSKLVSDIEQNSGVKLEAQGETEFNWIVGDSNTIADVKITGSLYQADNMKWENYDRMEKYLNDHIEMDSYNLADSPVAGVSGYYLDYVACNLSFKYLELQENPNRPVEPVDGTLQAKLACGYFNKNDISGIILAQKMRELLAIKYQESISLVKVNITSSDDNHVRGDVFFLNQQGEQGEGGIFLAAKVSGVWQIVFDGNGVIPCSLSSYGFPQEMLVDCATL